VTHTTIRDRHNADSSMTLNEIASILGISRERVRQIEHIAIKKLRHPKTARRLRDYLADTSGHSMKIEVSA